MRAKIKSFRSKTNVLASFVSRLYFIRASSTSERQLLANFNYNIVLALQFYFSSTRVSYSFDMFDVLDKTNQQYSRLRLFFANARIATITVREFPAFSTLSWILRARVQVAKSKL